MSWTLDPEDGPAQTGSTALWENMIWNTGGSFSDFTQATPTLALGGDDAFDLDVTLFDASAGFGGGCTSASRVCQQISANYVKIWVDTAPGIDGDPPPQNVPEPATWALLPAGLGLGSLRRRVFTS